MKPPILLKHIREEVTQTSPPAKIFILTGPTQRDCLRSNHLQQFSERNILKSNYFSGGSPGRKGGDAVIESVIPPLPPGSKWNQRDTWGRRPKSLTLKDLQAKY